MLEMEVSKFKGDKSLYSLFTYSFMICKRYSALILAIAMRENCSKNAL